MRDPWQLKNLEHYRKYQREYRKRRIKSDPEFRARIQKPANKARRSRDKLTTLIKRHGCILSIELFETLEAISSCQICNKPFSSDTKRCYDHNHTTGQVRGVLCRDCNFGLGHFKDNPEILFKAHEYLRSR